jgi:hypothetical protein
MIASSLPELDRLLWERSAVSQCWGMNESELWVPIQFTLLLSDLA